MAKTFSNDLFSEARKIHDSIIMACFRYFESIENKKVPIAFGNNDEKMKTYTQSVDYANYISTFHINGHLTEFFMNVANMIGDNKRIIDVGCSTGLSGLFFAAIGHDVTFCDFESIGLDFIRHFNEKHDLGCKIVAYGDEIEGHYDLALGIDVIEHTGNHLRFLKWIGEIADQVALTYPLNVKFEPPFVPEGLDEWIDDDAVCAIALARHDVKACYKADQRRYLFYNVED